jgi:hypothetical protein
VIAAVTDTQLVSLIVLTGTIKSEDFLSFIQDVIMKMRELYDSNDDQFVLLYDNAAVHKTKTVRDEVRH